jgi:hypothetical protein
MLSQVTASNQDVADVSTPRRNVSTRLADVFGDRPSRNHSARRSRGFRYHLEVSFHLIPCQLSLTPMAVEFLDESNEVRSQYTGSDTPFSSPPSGHQHSPKPGSAKSGRSPHDEVTPPHTVVTPTDGFTVLSLLNSESPSQSQLRGVPPRSHHDDHAHSGHLQATESSNFVYQQPPGQPILWPLEHEQEAMLLQHYIENVALFFDMVDTECHFGVHVVQRAKKNSTLMNAILALSARQLSRTTDFDPYIADAYYQRCFDTLIPALNENVAIKEESLLAATIILRLLVC